MLDKSEMPVRALKVVIYLQTKNIIGNQTTSHKMDTEGCILEPSNIHPYLKTTQTKYAKDLIG